MVLIYVCVRCLMCQTLCHVLLVLGVGRLLEVGPEGIVVVLQHFKDCILLVYSTLFIVDAVIENGGDMVFREPRLEDTVVFNSLRNVLGGKNCMELAVHTEYRPFSDYLVGYCDMMLVALIERLGLILHFEDGPVVHHRIVFRLLLRVITDLLHCVNLCLMESNHLTQLVFGHIILPIEVESENVSVRDTITEGVLVEHVAEDDFRGNFLL